MLKSYKKALDEKDKKIAELKESSKILQLEYENEKKRVHEKVNRLVNEIDFLEKSKAKKDAIGGYDMKTMQLKVDELENKLDGCRHKGKNNESNANVVKALETINIKLDMLSKADNRSGAYSHGDKQLEVILIGM